MQKSLVAATMLVLCVNAFARRASPGQDSTKSSAEQEIRAALCEIDKYDFAAAQKRVENALQSDPHNIYAQKLLPGMLGEQIKPKDKSPENIALIRTTIAAYQRATSNLQLSAEEKMRVDKYVLSLYGMISKEERTNELLRRVADSKRPPRDRSQWYASLAADSYYCANEITSKMGALEKSEIEKAKACVKKGLEYANQAITLNTNNGGGWNYKANLLNHAAVLAGIEHNPTQKAAYQKQYEEAEKRAYELFTQQRERELNEPEPTPTPTVDKEKFSRELTEYKAENSLADLVKQVYIPAEQTFESLMYNTKEKIRKEREDRDRERKAKLQEKHDWKIFSPADEDLMAELPDNVSPLIQENVRLYDASSEGVSYEIISRPRAASHTNSSLDDLALNTLAWAYVNTLNRFWLDGSTAQAFEMRLLRKETTSGQPGRVYSLAEISCAGKTEGTIIVYVGKARYYSVSIAGANESDQRVQHFLRSVKFK